MEIGETNHNLDGTVERTSRYPYCRFYTGNQTSTVFLEFYVLYYSLTIYTPCL